MTEAGAISPQRTGQGVRVRFRLPRSSYLAVVFLVFGVTALMVQPWFGFLYVVPVAVAFFIARRGTDVDANGITVHALLRSETFPWSVTRGLSVSDRGQVSVALAGTDGTIAATVRLPCVGVTALPVVAEASGGAVPALPAASIKAAPGRRPRR